LASFWFVMCAAPSVLILAFIAVELLMDLLDPR